MEDDTAVQPYWAAMVKRNRENPTQRKYSLDQHFFDEIDTPVKAYWLGFVAGDGCIADRALVVGLAAKDASHLRSLAADLRATNPVRMDMATVNGKSYPRAKLVLHSWRLVEALAHHGILPRKSADLQPWDGPADLMPHYWRGLVDADGHIILGPDWELGLVGTEAVTTAFGVWAKSVEPLIEAAANPHKSIWKFTVGGRVLARTVAQALYGDAVTALSRKAERAAALIASGPRVPVIRGTVRVDANGFRHGTSGYRRRCRCEICRAAHNADASAATARKNAGTSPDEREHLRRERIGQAARQRWERKREAREADSGADLVLF